MARAFRLLIIGCLASSLFGSEHFWFSYKVVTSNSVVVHEEKNISPAMVASTKKPTIACAIPLKRTPNLTTLDVLTQQFDSLLPCFYTAKSHIVAWDEQRDNVSHDRVEIIIQPVHFTVDFKEEFATIGIIR